jgi:hypothetical protein
MRPTRTSRREFVTRSAVSLITLPLIAEVAGAAEQVSLDDPTAKAIGYVHEAGASDKRTDTTQFCHNCQLYTGPEGDEWGPCQLFPGKVVNANGWCTAWVKKA